MKGTINQDAKTLESRANSIRVSAILKKYTMVIALVVVFIFFTALTGEMCIRDRYPDGILGLSPDLAAQLRHLLPIQPKG